MWVSRKDQLDRDGDRRRTCLYIIDIVYKKVAMRQVNELKLLLPQELILFTIYNAIIGYYRSDKNI